MAKPPVVVVETEQQDLRGMRALGEKLKGFIFLLRLLLWLTHGVLFLLVRKANA